MKGENAINIRKGEPEDIPSLLALIKELAAYERAPDEVIIDEAKLLADGFSKHPSFQFIVAEKKDEVVGIALYYFAYSTWKGRYLYLEDLVVKSSERQLGIGSMLFESVIEIAKKEKVKRLAWQVLNWNEPAIQFYKKYRADISDEWLNGRLYFD